MEWRDPEVYPSKMPDRHRVASIVAAAKEAIREAEERREVEARARLELKRKKFA